MASMSDLFRVEVIEWQGKRLELARANFGTEAAYRHYLESEARAAINRHRSTMDQVEYKAQLKAWQESCAAKTYDFGGEVWNKSMESRENACRWFWLVFGQPTVGADGKPVPKDEPITLKDMDAFWKDKADEVGEAWQRLMADPDADPNDPTAGEEPAAAPSPTTTK